MRLFRQLPFGSTLSISPGDINVGQRVSDGFPPLQPVDLSFADNPFGAMTAVDPHFRPSYAGSSISPSSRRSRPGRW